jgi:hypothetical protein
MIVPESVSCDSDPQNLRLRNFCLSLPVKGLHGESVVQAGQLQTIIYEINQAVAA